MAKTAKILGYVLAALVSAALLQGCGLKKKFSEIKLTSVEVESFKLTGMKTFEALVDVGVDNPAPSFDVKRLNAVVRKDTSAIVRLWSENVAVDGRSVKVYRIPVSGAVEPGYTLMDLAVLARNFKPEDYKVDVTARAEIGADIGKDLEFKDIPLSKLMKKE
ncbi:MAG: hypothetical protein K6C31_04815 [Bacteroidales bacterium]|nr:hypothetical protein [Bacteroidales bacterium]